MPQHAHPSPLRQLLRRDIDRRTFLRGTAMTSAAVMLSACGGGEESSSGSSEGGGGGGATSLGSNYSDQIPKDALAKVLDQYDGEVEINTVDHNTYQEQINNYLQANPQDVFAWFAGFRMQFFAERGLASPINDVWERIGGDFSDGVKQASTAGEDQFFVPFLYYPWGMFYRKSVFNDGGYEPPETLDELVSLCETMQSDGLTPIAFADKGGWEAMGTFDYINMRTNGYDFHVSLMAGEEAWDGDQVKEVFATWEQLLPFHQENALGRDWQEAAQALANKEAGMYLLGLFAVQQFPEEDRGDVDFFKFPEINSEFGTGAIEAPIDGFMLSASPENEAGAKELLTYLASAEAQELYDAEDPGFLAVNNNADRSEYTELNQKAIQVMEEAENVSQFMDRDTRPDFASTVMIPALQNFIRNPGEIDSILTQVEQQKQSIFSG